ncbi:MAG: hydrogenase maturation protease [Calditrichia bacterium]
MKTLILGIGNILMGDEGMGIHVIRYLQKNYPLPDVDIVDGGTGGFHLLDYFQRYQRVMLVDATIDGKAPGTITVLKPKFSSDYPPTLTAHDIGLKDLLDALYLLKKQPEIILFTISIPSLSELSLKLSEELLPAVKAAAESAVTYLKENPKSGS